MKKIAVVGTHGIPARYGGFETLAEQLVVNLNYKYRFTVYSNLKNGNFNNELVYRHVKIPFYPSGWSSMIYDFCSFLHAVFNHDLILYLGPSSGYLVPMAEFLGKSVVVNFGGLNEWERPKFSRVQLFFVKIFTRIAARYSSQNIVDNRLLEKSLKASFGVDSEVIRYGGDHVLSFTGIESPSVSHLKFKNYFLVVARAQIDSMFDMLIEAFLNTKFELVIVSNWDTSDYGKSFYKKYSRLDNVELMPALYNKNELNFVRENAYCYIHSHSYCGTAPSLVEAMYFGVPIISYDVTTNRETTKGKAKYFRTSEELLYLLNNFESLTLNTSELLDIAISEYNWSVIARSYDKVFEKI